MERVSYDFYRQVWQDLSTIIIKIIIIGKTLVLHKSAQEKHIFLKFFFNRKLLMSSI